MNGFSSVKQKIPYISVGKHHVPRQASLREGGGAASRDGRSPRENRSHLGSVTPSFLCLLPS